MMPRHPAEVNRSGPIACTLTKCAQALITGEESHATKFERGVQTLLADGGWEGTTWRVDAAFGVFGSLPLVGVTFGDAFVLLDTVNGALDGPFARNSPLSVSTLMTAHGGASDNTFTFRTFTGFGCAASVASGWHPSPPDDGTPAIPGGPIWSVPIYPDPFYSPNYTCRPLPISLWSPNRIDCRCVRRGYSRDGAGRVVPVKEVCVCTSCLGTGTGLGPPTGPVPPGGTPPTPGGSSACSCHAEYWY